MVKRFAALLLCLVLLASCTVGDALEPMAETSQAVVYVWVPATGHRYHVNPACSGMREPAQLAEDEALEQGYTRCNNCWRWLRA